jgi:mRNA-degrading endonuclease RelE of RelBE toxin-antitoxin system
MEPLITASALVEFTALPRSIQPRVIKLVERLRHWPNVSGAKPLSGELAGHYRLRTGDYRLQFRIDGGIVVVEHMGHRDGFYDD